MTTKLTLYNNALFELGERELASLTENRGPRRKLDIVYDKTVKFCLESASWNAATRTLQVEYDPSITSQFGYTFAFAKPSDWVRTLAVSADENFSVPLLDYADEQSYWFANGEPLFVRMISNLSTYGLDLSLWPESFVRYVEITLAERACLPITQDKTLKRELGDKSLKAKHHAQNIDNMNEPTKFPPRGTWSSARLSGRSMRNRELAP